MFWTMTKRATSIVLLISMLLLLAACGSGNRAGAEQTAVSSGGSQQSPQNQQEGAEPVTLKIYAKYSDADTKEPYDYAVAELKMEMPNVTLELDPMAQDDGQKLKTYAASGNMPDIFQDSFTTFQVLAKSNNLLLLDNEPETAKFKESMNNSAMGRLVAPDGHVYAYPFASPEFILLYYNKKIFEEVGIKAPIKTYAELEDAAKKLAAKNYIPLSIFAKEKWISRGFYNGILSREEPIGLMKLDDGSAKGSDPAFKNAADTVAKLTAAGLFSKDATNSNYDQASALFFQSKAAMFVNGQWEIYSAEKNLGDNVDWMYWPAKDEATYEKSKFVMNGAFGSIPEGFAVSPSTPNKELAVKVAAFMARKYAEFKYVKQGNPMVATKVDKPVEAQLPKMMDRLIKEVLPNIQGYANPNVNPKVDSVVGDNAQNLLVSGYTADDFAKSVDKAVESANK